MGEGAVVVGEKTGGGGIMGGGEGMGEGCGSCWGLRESFCNLMSTEPKLTPGCDSMVRVTVFCPNLLLLGFGTGGQTGIAEMGGLPPVVAGRGDGGGDGLLAGEMKKEEEGEEDWVGRTWVGERGRCHPCPHAGG